MTERRYSLLTDFLILVVIASAILTPKLGGQSWIGIGAAGLAGLGASVVYLRYGASANRDSKDDSDIMRVSSEVVAATPSLTPKSAPDVPSDTPSDELPVVNVPNIPIARVFYASGSFGIGKTAASKNYHRHQDAFFIAHLSATTTVAETVGEIVRSLSADEDNSYEFTFNGDGSLIIRPQKRKPIENSPMPANTWDTEMAPQLASRLAGC